MSFEMRRGEERMHESDRIVGVLLERIEGSDFHEDFQGEMALERKKKLKRIARKLPAIGDLLLRKYRELARKEGLDGGRLSFYLVGGRVRGTPIKDNTDFDAIITAENKLSPFASKNPNRLTHQIETATISFEQRHRLAK